MKGLSAKWLKRVFYLTDSLLAAILVCSASIPSYWILGENEPYGIFIISGLILGLLAKDLGHALFSSVSYSLISSPIYLFIFKSQFYIESLMNSNSLFFGDIIPKYVYEDLLLPLVTASSLEGYSLTTLIILSLGLSLSFCMAIYLLKNNSKIKELLSEFDFTIDVPKLVSALSILLVLFILANFSFLAMGNFYQRNYMELVPGEYHTDYNIYKRVYQSMVKGENYYFALRKALEDHADAEILLSGTYYSSPTWIRHPFIFHFYKIAGFNDANNILRSALVLICLSFLLIGIGLERHFPIGTGLLVSIFAYPYFLWQLAGKTFTILTFGDQYFFSFH